jgi:hypothetical protein
MQFNWRFTVVLLFLAGTQMTNRTLAQDLQKNKLREFSASVTSKVTVPTNTLKKKPIIPPDFHAQHFGFFCRQELKMHKAHVPVSFRVGSMDHCNTLEQKPGYK